jgi:hypothetical protein
MTRAPITAIFLTLFSHMAYADEMPDKGKYNAMIKDSLDLNGADCRVGTYSVIEQTGVAIIFSIKCTRASYLKEIEVTCTQTPLEQCFVSRY